MTVRKLTSNSHSTTHYALRQLFICLFSSRRLVRFILSVCLALFTHATRFDLLFYHFKWKLRPISLQVHDLYSKSAFICIKSSFGETQRTATNPHCSSYLQSKVNRNTICTCSSPLTLTFPPNLCAHICLVLCCAAMNHHATCACVLRACVLAVCLFVYCVCFLERKKNYKIGISQSVGDWVISSHGSRRVVVILSLPMLFIICIWRYPCYTWTKRVRSFVYFSFVDSTNFERAQQQHTIIMNGENCEMSLKSRVS